MATVLREPDTPSIGYKRGYPGRDEDQCSACGTYDSTIRVLCIHTRKRDDRYPSGWKEDSQLDAHFCLCDPCYFTLIGFLESHGIDNEGNPLKGYR